MKRANPKERDGEVQRYADIQMFRAMAIAASPFRNKQKGKRAEMFFDQVKGELKDMRQEQRSRAGDPLDTPHNLAKLENDRIKAKIRTILREKKATIIVDVGREAKAKFKNDRYGGDIIITVKHMWLQRVFKNIYGSHNRNEHRLSNDNDYFILSADEYRTNAPQVRLWKAIAYSFKDKEMVHGYIGQSKFGSHECTFRRTVSQAISSAQHHAALAITKQVIGEKHDQSD